MAYKFVYETRSPDGDAPRIEGKADTPVALLSEIESIRTTRAKLVEILSPDGRKLTVSDVELFAEKGVIYD